MLRLPVRGDARGAPTPGGGLEDARTVLYDTASDPGQMTPIRAPGVERRLIGAMLAEMRAHVAPLAACRRLNLAPPA